MLVGHLALLGFWIAHTVYPCTYNVQGMGIINLQCKHYPEIIIFMTSVCVLKCYPFKQIQHTLKIH